jgi:hypothetical protein
MRMTPQSGMNIFELLFFIVNVSLGVAVCRWAFHHYGWIGGVLGFIAGCTIIPIIVMLPAWFRRRARRKGIW